MSRLLLRIVLVLAALAATVVVVGMILPRNYSTSHSIEIDGSPEEIYPLIAEMRQWRRWSAWGDHIKGLELTYSGPESGAGASMSWKDPRPNERFDGQLSLTSANSPTDLEYTSAIGQIPMDGRIELKRLGDNRTQVSWSAAGRLPSGAAYGYLALTYEGLLRTNFLEPSLAKLKNIVEDVEAEAEPQPPSRQP